MIAADYDHAPTIAEELARKTVDYLTEQVHLAEAKRLPDNVLAEVGRALWNVTSGLVPEDVATLCTRVAESAKPAPMKRHFILNGTLRTIAWFPHKPGYVVFTRGQETGYAASLAGTVKRTTEIDHRARELETLFAGLRKAGYVEL